MTNMPIWVAAPKKDKSNGLERFVVHWKCENDLNRSQSFMSFTVAKQRYDKLKEEVRKRNEIKLTEEAEEAKVHGKTVGRGDIHPNNRSLEQIVAEREFIVARSDQIKEAESKIVKVPDTSSPNQLDII